MSTTAWNITTTAENAYKRAGGRRGYNGHRQQLAILRLQKITALLGEVGFQWGSRSELARRLGVSRSTICRDMQHLERMCQGGAEYAAEFQAFSRYWRRTYGENQGPQPGSIWPQMRRSPRTG